jgi:hypothetical protein
MDSHPGFFGGMRDRVVGIFKIHQSDSMPVQTMQPIQQVHYQQPLPSTEPPQAPAIQRVAAEQGPKLFLKHDFEKKIGAADDYAWITGQLFYVHTMDGGMWVVRYASPEEEDKYGGGVVLAPTISMKNYREGDLVCVHGDVLQPNRTSRHLGGALYRVDHIDLVERAD